MENIIAGALGGMLAALILPSLLKLTDWPLATKTIIQRIAVVALALVSVTLWSSYKHQSALVEASNTMDVSVAKAQQAQVEGKDVEASLQAQFKELQRKSPASTIASVTDQFFGFYMINARSRFAYCQSLGVDLTAFVAEFSQSNRAELTAARAQLKATGRNEDALYREIEPMLVKSIAGISKAQADQYHVTEAEFCQEVAKNATEYAKLMTFAANAPEQDKLLLVGK